MSSLARWLCLSLIPFALHAADFEQVRERAVAANAAGLQPYGVFRGSGDWLHLSPEGDYTQQTIAMCSMGGAMPIERGRYSLHDGYLLIEPPSHRVDVGDSLLDDAPIYSERLLLDKEQAAGGETRRLWLIPQSDGLYLMDERRLGDVANMLNTSGGLPQWLLYSRDLPRDDDNTEFEIEDQNAGLSAEDRARLPLILARLLRELPVEAKAVALENADQLAWSEHRAVLRVRLDRGENSGLYKGMEMRSAAPEEFFGKIIELDPNSALLEVELSRFHPDDKPALPASGSRFFTPRQGEGCHSQPGFAISGRVLSLQPERKQDLSWDADGYAFVWATLDVGRGSGLIVGDRLLAGSYSYDLQAEVRSLTSDRAEVLIRLHRYRFDELVNEVLATNAWWQAQEESGVAATLFKLGARMLSN